MDHGDASLSPGAFASSHNHQHHHRHMVYANKRLLYDIKIAIVVTIGVVIIMACVVYIVLQCRRKTRVSFHLPRHRDSFADQQTLMENLETTENLLNEEPTKERDVRYREFYV